VTTNVLLSLLLAVQTDTSAISRYIQTEVERQHIPGLSVAVLSGDRVVWSRGYGFANVELHVPASDSTIYQSGSMGKQFTAALVEMLVDQHSFVSTTRSCAGSPRARRYGKGSRCGTC
jgi:CubicO group peptidase (beta-lactamase class C family)